MFRVGEVPVPGYKLVRAIGRGQYGEVWESEAPGGARVALKFIPLQSKSGSVEVRAVQAVKRIRHANLIPVNAIWVLDNSGNVLDDDAINKISTAPHQHSMVVDQFSFEKDLAYLVIAMALADESLEGILKQRQEEGEQGIPRDELVEYVRQAAKGLDFLNETRHEVDGKTVGITHRDVKPANLLLIGDSVVVGDFGVATTLKEFDATATNVVGSLGFMAPESIAQKPSPSTDQYALAITYYRLRTGGLPYDETVSVDKLIEIHRTGKLEFRGVSSEERVVLQRATSQKPEDRYENCAAFVAALGGSIPAAKSSSKPSSAKTSSIVAAISALTVIILLLIWQPWKDNAENTGHEKDDQDNVDKHSKNGGPNSNHSNDTNENKPIKIPERALSFHPSGVTFKLNVITKNQNGEWIESDEYNASDSHHLKIPDEGQLKVTAESESPFFDSLEQTYTIEQLKSLNWRIALPEISVDEVRQKAFTLVESGDSQAAIELLANAAKVNLEVLQPPKAVTIETAGKFVNAALSPTRQLVFATMSAKAGDAPSQCKLLVIADFEESLNAIEPTENGSSGKLVEQLLYSEKTDKWFVIRSDSIWAWRSGDSNQFERVWEFDQQSSSRIEHCAISDDGGWLAWGDFDGVVRVLQITMDGSFGKTEQFNPHSDEPVSSVVFQGRRDALSLVSVSVDGSIAVLRDFTNGQDSKPEELNIDPGMNLDEIVEVTRVDSESILVADSDSLFKLSVSNLSAPLVKLASVEEVDLVIAQAKNKLVLSTSRESTGLLRIQPLDNSQNDRHMSFDSGQISSVQAVVFANPEGEANHAVVFATEAGKLFYLDLSKNESDLLEFASYGEGTCKALVVSQSGKQLLVFVQDVGDTATRIIRINLPKEITLAKATRRVKDGS